MSLEISEENGRREKKLETPTGHTQCCDKEWTRDQRLAVVTVRRKRGGAGAKWRDDEGEGGERGNT